MVFYLIRQVIFTNKKWKGSSYSSIKFALLKANVVDNVCSYLPQPEEKTLKYRETKKNQQKLKKIS